MKSSKRAMHENTISNIVNLDKHRKCIRSQDFMDKNQPIAESAAKFRSRLGRIQDKAAQSGVESQTFYYMPKKDREKLTVAMAALNNKGDDESMLNWQGAYDIVDDGLSSSCAMFWFAQYQTKINKATVNNQQLFHFLKTMIDCYPGFDKTIKSDLQLMLKNLGLMAGRVGSSIYETYEDDASDLITEKCQEAHQYALDQLYDNQEDRYYEEHLFKQELKAANEERV